MEQEKLKDLEQRLNTNLEVGLDEEKISSIREKTGSNVLEAKKKKSLFVKFLLEFKDVLIIILLVAAIVSVIIEPEDWIESVIILAIVILNAVLGVYQENKAEKSLEALQKMTSPSAKVIRNGVLKSIPSSEVVVGDIMLIEAGDSICADGTIIECSNLKIDESALTGESLAVDKNNIYIADGNIPLGDRKNCVFSSTAVTNGKAKIIVTSTGMNTEIGKIASMLNNQQDNLTPLQHKLNTVGKAIGIIALGICLIVFILELIPHFGSSDMSVHVVESFKTAVALAVAAIPEGLAAVVTIILSLGVGKMSKRNAIVKKLPAVETLGCTNVVCSDKTGTLTQNKMTVVKLYLNELKEPNNLTDDEKKLIKYFAVCSDASITNNQRIGDPTELALLDAARANLIDYSDQRLLDIPFDSERKLMTTVIKSDNKYIAITKGAPDVVLSIAANNKDDIEKATNINQEMASNALRGLALGIKQFDSMPSENDLEKDIYFLGLVGMIDPARDEVKASIALAHEAGIKTVMITGDHIITAKAIAKNLGIMGEGDKAITSEELDKLSDEYLKEHIKEYSVYARVAPKDKVRIVEAWQSNDAIVAMTGDGVNDAPALKKADIGCAMGITGTDVSKEAADMILVDDNFSTIICAVKEGRGIYQNIKKCVKYLLASNIGEVITIFVASLLSAFGLGLGIPLASIHLLWINLITDSLPVFGIGMEDVDDDVMNSLPRPKKEGFFAGNYAIKIVIEGVLIGVLTLIAYLIGNTFYNHTVGQTMAFLTLSTTQLFHAFNIKSEHSIFSKRTFKNKVLNIAFVIGFVLQIFVIYCPGVNDIFQLQALDVNCFFTCIGLALIIIVAMEISKLVSRILAKRKNVILKK